MTARLRTALLKLSLDPAFLPQGRAPVGGVTIRDPVSETTSKLHESYSKGKGPLHLKNKRRWNHESSSSTDSERNRKRIQKPLLPKDDKDQEKSKVREESDSTIPDPSHQTVTSTPPVIAPFIDVSSSKPSLLVTPPPINTEATTITTSLPEITPFIALQLRVARLEQEISEVKKTDHSANVLASIRSQVPTAVDNYLGTKLDDAPSYGFLERHIARFKSRNTFVWPESCQEFKRSEMIRKNYQSQKGTR
ncbi:hypothetical protein Tco_0215165 [Tanacetum coccineum]